MRALKILTAGGLVVFLLVILVPFWWIASMSFKTYEQIQFATSIYVPKPFTWENYSGLWSETRFPLWLQNSLVTALVVTVTTTVIASLAGYAVARIKFPGREAIASLILILYLIPPRCSSSRSTACSPSWAPPTTCPRSFCRTRPSPCPSARGSSSASSRRCPTSSRKPP
jgi:ABC-type glycerol-3-phosphate transport system permease component